MFLVFCCRSNELVCWFRLHDWSSVVRLLFRAHSKMWAATFGCFTLPYLVFNWLYLPRHVVVPTFVFTSLSLTDSCRLYHVAYDSLLILLFMRPFSKGIFTEILPPIRTRCQFTADTFLISIRAFLDYFTFCAKIRRESVSFLMFPSLSHFQVFSCEISLVYRLKYSFRCFCFLVIIVLLSLGSFVLFLVAVISISLLFYVVVETSYRGTDVIRNTGASSSSFSWYI